MPRPQQYVNESLHLSHALYSCFCAKVQPLSQKVLVHCIWLPVRCQNAQLRNSSATILTSITMVLNLISSSRLDSWQVKWSFNVDLEFWWSTHFRVTTPSSGTQIICYIIVLKVLKFNFYDRYIGGGLTRILPLIAPNWPVRQRHNAAKCFFTA